jgi:phosphoglycolate phosphatase
MSVLGSTADSTVYLGDSEVDVETAKNAGIAFIGVTWGFRDRQTLLQAGAKRLIDTPQELLEIIEPAV